MIQAIAKELFMRKNESDEKIESIYFGGGTPSILKIEEINFLLKIIFSNYDVIENPEITLEANPDDLTSEKLKELADTKINRLSIGVQSFFDDDLRFMNRAHSAAESEISIIEAKKYFDNISIDLIYGLPNMSNQKWLENLQKGFELKVSHISSYALTVEEKTALANFIAKGKMPSLDENLAEQHFQILMEQTKKHDFIQYEISNFGKSDYFSKHNTSYWQGKTYLGFGPAAHSFNKTSRSWNIANNTKYISAIFKESLPLEVEILSQKDRFNEAVMTGLRTIWGVSLAKIEIDFGLSVKESLILNAQKHLKNLSLEIKNNTLFTSDKGKFLADGIASDLFMV